MARGSTPIRLALAFLIGAAAGPWFNLTHPTTLDALLNALVIAVPPLLAVLLIGIRLQEHSRLSEILGTAPYAVNSLHHQAVARPGECVEIVGWSPDGVAEAMEIDGHPFALAVQFHPEELESDPEQPDEPSRALFRAFVQACSERMAR